MNYYDDNNFYNQNTSHAQEDKVIVYEERKPKKARFRSALAGVMAVVVIGGAAGFGGAYIATNQPQRADITETVTKPQIPLETTPSDEQVTLSTDTLVSTNRIGELSTMQLYENMHQAVVGIKIYETRSNGFYQTEDTEGSVVGSGVIFTVDGYLLTNQHVVTDYTKIGVLASSPDDEEEMIEYPATIIGIDKLTDLAVLKIERDEDFVAAPIGSSNSLKVGQQVCAIGYPMGLSKSMTSGIVSGLNREESGYELSSIQTDAALNMGNSGGPLFDLYGNVVGIVNKKYVYDNLVDNIGFAISIDEAKPIINDLVEHGEVTTRPALGITTFPVDEYTAEYFGLGDIKHGLLVTNVQEGSSAQENGLAKGDIIVELEGEKIETVEDVQTILKNKSVGDTVKVVVARFDTTGKVRMHDLEFELIAAIG